MVGKIKTQKPKKKSESFFIQIETVSQKKQCDDCTQIDKSCLSYFEDIFFSSSFFLVF